MKSPFVSWILTHEDGRIWLDTLSKTKRFCLAKSIEMLGERGLSLNTDMIGWAPKKCVVTIQPLA